MHGQAAVLKREIEAKLASRIPAALSPVAQRTPRLHPIGNARLDSLLGGGLPLGTLCELTGPEGSGRSSIALSLLASASTQGACAYVDVSDALSPRSAASAGTRLHSLNVIRARDLKLLRHGVKARIAGQVIARQRPGTAHGFIFLSIEDETGIANAIVDPDLYEANRPLVSYAKFLLIEGTLQNVDKVIHIRAKHIEELNVTAAPMESHDFY